MQIPGAHPSMHGYPLLYFKVTRETVCRQSVSVMLACRLLSQCGRLATGEHPSFKQVLQLQAGGWPNWPCGRQADMLL